MPGLILENVTNLDKSRPAHISQENAFTICERDRCTMELSTEEPCENLWVTSFTFFCLSQRRYKFIKWLVRKLL